MTTIYEGKDIFEFSKIFQCFRRHPLLTQSYVVSNKNIHALIKNGMRYEVVDMAHKKDIRVCNLETGQKIPIQDFSCASDFDSEQFITQTVLKVGRENKNGVDVFFESHVGGHPSFRVYCYGPKDDEVISLLVKSASTC